MPSDAEDAAAALRRKIGVGESEPIGKMKLLRAMDARDFTVRMEAASGYTVPKGIVMCSCALVALNEDDDVARQKFTVGHELGHAVVGAAKWRLNVDEEAWCDNFSSAILLPRQMLAQFAHTASLVEWLDLPTRFEVSVSVAMRRAWHYEMKLIVVPNMKLDECPRQDDAARLLTLMRGCTQIGETNGTLHNGVRYVVRRTKHSVAAVADFAPLTEVLMKIFEDGAYRTAGANLFTLFAFALLGFFRTVSGGRYSPAQPRSNALRGLLRLPLW